MTTRQWTLLGLSVAALALMAPLGGCEREISRDSETKYYRDGSVKHNADVVTQSPDGTVTRERTTHTENR